MDWSALILVPGAALTAVWWTQLLGLPVAWLKVRRTYAWKERPNQVGGYSLLKDFIGLYIFGAMVFGAVVGLATFIGTFFS